MYNESELAASIQIVINSTALSCNTQKVTIPPRQMASIEITLSPTKINPQYVREVVIRNLNNPDNENIVVVRARNMDPHHIIYHSLFYKLLLPSPHSSVERFRNTNTQLHMENVAINSTAVQTFRIKNVTKLPISLMVCLFFCV